MTSFYKPTPEQEGQGQPSVPPQRFAQGPRAQNSWPNSDQGIESYPTNQHPVAPMNPNAGVPRSPLPPTGAGQQVPHNGAPLGVQTIARVTTSPQEPEIEGGNRVILHRSTNFFVRTSYRPGQHTQQVNPLRKPSGQTKIMPKVMPEQNQRVAESETRVMPNVTPINPVNKKRVPVPLWLEGAVIAVGLLISLVVHAINMFNFPRYELDEGTYMSSAWAILNGMITPYAYGYGHPPVAWIQIAGWVQMTGGFFTFGNALNSGRVLMLIYALGCSLLVYLIVRRLGESRSSALLAMLVFSLSPLSVSYQRQILLDNIATFWLLFSLFFLVAGKSRLANIALAGICFGIAILSKEVFLLFIPCMIYAVWLHTTKFQRKFAVVAFTYTVIALSSSFILMAVLKGELFPYSWHLPWDHHDHLSMLQTFLDQTKRGQNEGSFAQSWKNWTDGDLLLMVLSIVTVAFNLAVGWWHRKQLLLALFALSFWVLLIRGGVVLSFYLIPLIPLIAINTALALGTIGQWISKLTRVHLLQAAVVLAALVALVPYDALAMGVTFTQRPTSAQTEAIGWVREHVPHNSFIVINSYLYMDLRENGGQGVGDGATFPYAHVYFNVATDPELRDKLLQGNWDRIDYIIADSEMLNDIKNFGGPMNMIKTALNHSVMMAEFKADDHDKQIVIQVYKVIHKFPPSMVDAPSAPAGSTPALALDALPRNTRSLQEQDYVHLS